MSVEIVVHRGIKNILYDNSMVGILAAVFRNKFCEFDILWTDGKWKVCHDFTSLSIYHTRLSDLLSLFKQYQHLVKNKIIIDIKWDSVWNRHDSLTNAVQQLKHELVGFETYPFWLQVSHPRLLELLVVQRDIHVWKLGMIIYNMSAFSTYQEFIDYAMIPLSDFSEEDILHMSQECLLFGYTCHNTNELCHYKHLFKYLKGIVCDVSL